MPLPVENSSQVASRRSETSNRDDRSQGRGYREEPRDARQDIEQARRRAENNPPPPSYHSSREGARGRQNNDRPSSRGGGRLDKPDYGRDDRLDRDRHLDPRENSRPDPRSKTFPDRETSLSRGLSPSKRPEQLNGGQASNGGALSRTPPPQPRPSAPMNFLVAELRKAGQSLLSGRPQPQAKRTPPRTAPSASRSPEDDDDGMEAGEIPADEDEDGSLQDSEAPGSESERKRRMSLQEVGGPASKAPRRSTVQDGPKTMLNRVFEDVASFKQQLAEMDVDPEAPALIKSSPSASGEDDEEDLLAAKLRQQREAALQELAGRAGNSSEDEEDVEDDSGKQSRVMSRWLVDNDNGMENQEDDKRDGDNAEEGGVAPEPGLGPGSSGGGFDSEEDDMESMPPSPRTSLNRTYNMLQECRSVDEFEKISRISEGTYGVVYKAREKSTGRLVALKRIKMEKEKDGFPVTSIREINVLLNFHHPNMVHVSEIVISYKNPDHIFMVMDLMDHDLKGLMEPSKGRLSRPFSIAEVKCLMLQLLRGVEFMHSNWVLHRDLKPANILYSCKGELKICDFGLARQYGSPLKPYTHMVVTLWYRCPELLFGTKTYSTAVDVWSVGCIMGELLMGSPICPGQSELDQLEKIVALLGTPTDEQWPGLKSLPNFGKVVLKQLPSQLRNKFQNSFGGAVITEAGFDLLSQLLAWDPERRITAEAALKHKWFAEAPLPQKQELMPTFATK
ncbi:hypothetical protein CEUSTIGMA_g8035.t1 [Chlamydomonas eustigma]|uniref:Protein kinase domain-containing protein n=1 Tax=Chlamydomonas eustigma TaxID=1157962 RepID=A0A250XCW3_9CHLO|nr:hypothetical protein CEUSTIGMA_g8035.t1 [Chlamydomonas eustigma]|eukprot:GAX80600.1 hypothetical protein CEUSTIGMA_g8035.t1 [Chlamydomonas eustigma]